MGSRFTTLNELIQSCRIRGSEGGGTGEMRICSLSFLILFMIAASCGGGDGNSGVCTSGNFRCAGQTVERCAASGGGWEHFEDCGSGESCIDGD